MKLGNEKGRKFFAVSLGLHSKIYTLIWPFDLDPSLINLEELVVDV